MARKRDGPVDVELRWFVIKLEDALDNYVLENILVNLQAEGWRLFAWIPSRTQETGFDFLCERRMPPRESEDFIGAMNSSKWQTLATKITTAPWQIYYYEPNVAEYHLRKGEEFKTLRLVTKFLDIVRTGDQAMLVRMEDPSEPVGLVEIVQISRLRVRDLGPGELDGFRAIYGGQTPTVEQVRAALSRVYNHPVSLDTEVVALRLRALQEIHSQPLPPLHKRLLNRFLQKAGVTIV